MADNVGTFVLAVGRVKAGAVDFSADVSSERGQLLLDASARLDALGGHLGGTGAGGASCASDNGVSDEGDYGSLLRGLTEDSVAFGALPDIIPIPILELPHLDHRSAAWKAALDDGFTFLWVRIPLLLFPRKNWAFNRLEVRIEFNPGEPDPRLRPKAFDILPNRRFDTVMKVGAQFSVKVGADGHFAVDTGNVALNVGGVSASAGAGAGAAGSIGTEVGFAPVPYRAVAARVNHTDEGLEKVFWRLDGAEFFQEAAPQLAVIVQVPRGCTRPAMLGIMQAYRRFNLFPAGLQAAIRQLPEALRTFFAQGAPIRATARYELIPATGR